MAILLAIDSASAVELSGFDTLFARTSLAATTNVSGLTLGISDEIRVNMDGLVHNRASLGVSRNINNNMSVTAYYMLNSTGTDLSNTGHIAGLGLNISL